MEATRAGTEEGWIDGVVNIDLISYHKILKERKTIDQTYQASLAFLTILIKKKYLADCLINQPILLNQNK